jgi:lipopolysaccharide/colanic/teichoic acid biosynthesis glycosyltransferase
MIDNAEAECGPTWAKDDDCRVTRVGRIIRKLRLDEIPQMWNVLKGDMSFVGPRPERPEFVKELEKIVPYYSERHTVKPGITGWAQVSYGYGASVEDALEKLRYDLFYIKNISQLMDFMIIVKTIKIVLQQSGAR